MNGLRPYPAYKDSAQPWLGEVPEHWEVRRMKTLLHPVDVRSTTGTEEKLTVSSANGVVPRKSMSVTMFEAKSYVGHKLCWPDDLVINSLWAWGGGLGVTATHGIISSAYGVYRRRVDASLHPEYLHRLVRSSPYHWVLRVRSKGVWISRLQLTDDAFLDAPCIVPPPPEQAAIVKVLSAVDRRVNRLVRAKRRLLALLAEQKQAVITHAVTRGLDPSAPTKPSGVPWLGEVPEHWDVAPLYAMYDAVLGKMLDSSRVKGKHSVLYLRNADVGWDKINFTSLPSFDLHPDERARFTVQLGDLLVCEGGAGVGQTAIWKGELAICGFQKALHRLRRRSERDKPRFFYYCMRVLIGTGMFRGFGGGATIPHLTGDKLRRYRFPRPSQSEQEAIVDTLDAQCETFDAAADLARREIDLIREYRTRLVADVVTGKLDVRSVAEALPDEAEDDEPVDTDEPEAEDDASELEPVEELAGQ